MSQDKPQGTEQPEATDGVKPATEQEERAIAAVDDSLKGAALMVNRYAKKIVGDERALKFATQLSVISSQYPLLKECTQDSIITAMLACIQTNLIPNTPSQDAFVVPYRDNKTGKVNLNFQVGYKGMVKVAYRSGIKRVTADLVFPEDDFDVDRGTEHKLRHKPNYDIDRTDYTKATKVYATAILDDGTKFFEVMSKQEVEKVKDTAKAKQGDTPWKKWPEAMAKKTAIKRLSKLLPSENLQLAAEIDSWAESGKLSHRDGEVTGDNAEDKQQRDADIEQAVDARRKDVADGKAKPAEPAKQGDDS